LKQPVVLRVFRNGKLEGVRQFTADQIVIGQGGEVQLALNGTKVSPLHTMIEDRGGVYYVSDLGSIVGTQRNGRPVLEDKLQNGDEIQIGEFTIQFFVGVPKPAGLPVPPGEENTETDISFKPMTPIMTSPVSGTRGPQKAPPPPTKNNPPAGEDKTSVRAPTFKPLPPKTKEEVKAAPAFVSAPKSSISVKPSRYAKPKKDAQTFAPVGNFKDARDIIKPGKGSVVEILVLWKERVLSTHHFFNKGEVFIGGGSDSDIIVPTLSSRSRYQLLKVQGAITVMLSPEMTGELIRENESVSLAELTRQNKIRTTGQGGELDLRQGEMLKIHLAQETVSLMIRYKAETPKPLVAPLFDFTSSELTGVILAGVISAIFALYMSLYAPSSLNDDEARIEEPIRKAVVTFNPPKVIEEVKEEPKPEPKKVVEVKDKAASIKSDTKSTTSSTAVKPTPAAKPNPAKPDPGKAAEVAPKKTQDKQKKLTSAKSGASIKTGAHEGANMKSEKPDPSKVGLLGVFGSKGTQKQLDTTYSGSGELQGMAQQANGNSGSNEDRAGDSMGSKLKDTGAGGKGTSTIGIAGVGTNGRGTGNTGFGTGGLGQKGSVKVDVGGQEASFSGSIDRDAIRRVIQAHKAEIRFCYDRELQKSPGLAGKISIGWNITETGAAIKAGVESNDMGNAAVASCIVNKLKTWGFPPAPPDVEAHVIYPFVFTAQ
jgi:hypothetical protein